MIYIYWFFINYGKPLRAAETALRVFNLERKIRGPVVLLLGIGFFISLTALIIYSTETDYSDKTLYLLLAILRYSSFLVFISSIYMLTDSIISIFRKPAIIPAVRMVVSFGCLLYAAGIIIMDAFIISFTEGIG
jgi:hypothetical protein